MRLILGLSALAIVGAGAFAIAGSHREESVQPRADRPELMLVTTLPILFPEEFTIQSGGSKALAALETRYTVVPIATTDAQSLSHARLLLMAHPLAQPAENLVDLDQWVRGGGRVLLLADPRLEWPSKLPLGDKLRPPPSFADTGLLAHWGLRLEAPDDLRPTILGGGQYPVVYPSAGRLVSTNPACDLSRATVIAECMIGKGKATVVADADFLNVEELGELKQNNLDELLELLAALES